MNGRRAQLGVSLVAAILLPSLPAFAAQPSALRVSGSIAGYVRDSRGVPQMGATVVLVNRYGRVLGQSLTNDRGIFGFASLAPDLYSVRVSFAAFVPAIKSRIAVKAGLQSLLYINLASVFSSVELVYASPGEGALMSDDWKWTLKTDSATRPILRLRDSGEQQAQTSPDSSVPRPVFSGTLAMLRVSAGDSEGPWAGGMEGDLGTAFALATSLYGRNRLQVSGNLGYAGHVGSPNAGFRTTFSRDGSPVELSITFRQLYLPERFGAAQSPSSGDGSPALRTVSLQFHDHIDLGGLLRLDYGSALDSISFLNNVNYASPYGRLTFDMGSLGALQFGFSSGAPPMQPPADASPVAEAQLHDSLAALAMMPAISLRGGSPEVQRAENFELGYEKRFRSRTIRLSGYSESVTNAAVIASAPAGLLQAGDMLPDFQSNSGIFDAGNYRATGYSATLEQAVGDKTKLQVGYGGGDALAFSSGAPLDNSQAALDLRSRFHVRQNHWASAGLTTTLPRSGTQISASYEWIGQDVIQPLRYSVLDGSLPLPGCNIHIQQPLPSGLSLGRRLEATADLQNLLAQGYVSVPAANNQRVVLTQTPRMVRGGLAFIF